MKTTVDLHEAVLRTAKIVAAGRKITLHGVLASCILISRQ